MLQILSRSWMILFYAPLYTYSYILTIDYRHLRISMQLTKFGALLVSKSTNMFRILNFFMRVSFMIQFSLQIRVEIIYMLSYDYFQIMRKVTDQEELMHGITKQANISWLSTALDYSSEFMAIFDIVCSMLRMQMCWLFGIFEHIRRAFNMPFLTNYSEYNALLDEAMHAKILAAAALKLALPGTCSKWKQKLTRLLQLNKSASTFYFSVFAKQQNALRIADRLSSLFTNKRHTSKIGIRIDMTFPFGKALTPLTSNMRTNRQTVTKDTYTSSDSQSVQVFNLFTSTCTSPWSMKVFRRLQSEYMMMFISQKQLAADVQLGTHSSTKSRKNQYSIIQFICAFLQGRLQKMSCMVNAEISANPSYLYYCLNVSVKFLIIPALIHYEKF